MSVLNLRDPRGLESFFEGIKKLPFTNIEKEGYRTEILNEIKEVSLLDTISAAGVDLGDSATNLEEKTFEELIDFLLMVLKESPVYKETQNQCQCEEGQD